MCGNFSFWRAQKFSWLLYEVHTIGRTMLITFLDRRNSENS